jgi:hypothetical protein
MTAVILSSRFDVVAQDLEVLLAVKFWRSNPPSPQPLPRRRINDRVPSGGEGRAVAVTDERWPAESTDNGIEVDSRRFGHCRGV